MVTHQVIGTKKHSSTFADPYFHSIAATDDVDVLCSKALYLAKNGHIQEAIDTYRHLIKRTSDNVDVLYNLGLLLIQKGCYQEAISMLRECLEKVPSDVSTLNNIAQAHLNIGQLEEASIFLEKALAISPRHKNALCNLGLVKKAQNRHDQAISLFRRCIQHHPAFHLAYRLLGDACQDIGKPQDAAFFYATALKLLPDDADIISSLALALTRMGKKSEALVCYQKAIECRPGDYTLHNKYATVLEKCNRLDDARIEVNNSLKLLPNNYGAIVNLAVLEYRDANYEHAHNYLMSLDIKGKTYETAATIRQLQGLVLDKLGRYTEAFAMFRDANQFEMRSPAYQYLKGSHQSDLRNIRDMSSYLSAERIRSWRPLPYTPFTTPPVFLVGFPRSGTTLMEQVLNAHPKIITLDEQTPLQKIIKDFSLPPEKLRKLEDITQDDLKTYRESYYGLLRERTNSIGSDLLPVDKMPLNILHLPMIYRFFPEAKVIVILRHPLDCILSNFIQRFKLNLKMMNFLTLQNTAQFYDLTMSTYLKFRKALPGAVYEIKYESLIEDLQGETKKLASFLEKDWTPDMLNYHLEAARRIINTPSYIEVVKPVHRKARYRWKNYRDHLAPVIPIVKKYLDQFEYNLKA